MRRDGPPQRRSTRPWRVAALASRAPRRACGARGTWRRRRRAGWRRGGGRGSGGPAVEASTSKSHRRWTAQWRGTPSPAAPRRRRPPPRRRPPTVKMLPSTARRRSLSRRGRCSAQSSLASPRAPRRRRRIARRPAATPLPKTRRLGEARRLLGVRRRPKTHPTSRLPFPRAGRPARGRPFPRAAAAAPRRRRRSTRRRAGGGAKRARTRVAKAAAADTAPAGKPASRRGRRRRRRRSGPSRLGAGGIFPGRCPRAEAGTPQRESRAAAATQKRRQTRRAPKPTGPRPSPGAWPGRAWATRRGICRLGRRRRP
mmetsp:Transcript_25861/g.88902  ORF Transcript_25861/g.88902 Transcript_25861/m.88902 type:complete len:313 (+) Transcript_25861:748-1686(+)